jgi:hypothetical protein
MRIKSVSLYTHKESRSIKSGLFIEGVHLLSTRGRYFFRYLFKFRPALNFDYPVDLISIQISALVRYYSEEGAVVMMSQRTSWSGPQNLKNNTGFGVIRIQVASKSARAPHAGSDRYRYRYSCIHTVPVSVL